MLSRFRVSYVEMSEEGGCVVDMGCSGGRLCAGFGGVRFQYLDEMHAPCAINRLLLTSSWGLLRAR
jgi:hypothetical protein